MHTPPKQSLTELIHARDALRETIDTVSERVEAQLDKGLSAHQDRKRLSLAQNLFSKIQGQIDDILKSK